MTIVEIENALKILFNKDLTTSENIVIFTPHLMDWVMHDYILDYEFDQKKATSNKKENFFIRVKTDGGKWMGANATHLFEFEYDEEPIDPDEAYKRAMSII